MPAAQRRYRPAAIISSHCRSCARSVGIVHFDAHSDTTDSYFGGEKYTHGTPFRRAVEEGLADPKRMIQIGVRGSMYSPDEKEWAESVGTGTPEIGGFSTAEAQRMIRLLDGLDLVGGDVVEVAPPFDPSGNTALVGATMMFEILCVLAPAVHRRKHRMQRL